ncbi:sugar phosphate isomerase/epimerase [Longispora sp. K20-0274]|uniref:sugar phosphate isomerase/epimerase family protein n=1 Tax=Longispora sp. K20-0274 TaxID=3088255 RepID=UPI00399BD0E1
MDACLNRATLALDTTSADVIRSAFSAGFRFVEISAQRLGEAIDQAPDLVDILGSQGIVPIHGGWNTRLHWPRERFTASLQAVGSRMAFAARHGSTGGTLDLPRPGLDANLEEWHEEIIDRISAVCELADQVGLSVLVEFNGLHSPQLAPVYSDVRQALGIIEDIKLPNLGLLVDSFHWHSSGGTVDDLRLIPDRMPLFVHINDAPALARAELDDSMRLLPGDGVIDLPGLVTELRRRRYTGQLSVELKNPVLHAMDPVQAARRALEAVRSVAGLSDPGVEP